MKHTLLASTRYATLCLTLVLIVACGQEAPARADVPTPGMPTALPLSTALPALVDTPRPATAAQATGAPTPADPRALGNPKAPITVIEYSDFQCPFCAGYVRDTEPLLLKEYINTGKVYYVYRDFPLKSFHPGATQAAQFARCVSDQGKFWDIHARLYRGQDAGEWGPGGPQDLKVFLGYASELKLDTATVQQCVASQKYAAAVQNDLQQGIQHGVTGTPSFVVNGQLFVGAQPIGNWRKLLDGLSS